MYRRVIFLLGVLLMSGCGGLLTPPGFVSFKYSLWLDNNDGTFSDIGCIDAGVASIRADLFFKGVNVATAESVCSAFGNSDGTTTLDELGEFLAEVDPTTFDQLQVTAIKDDGSLMSFGMRVNDADRPFAKQQAIDLVEPVAITSGQTLTLSLPGETGSQIDSELQMIIQ